MESSFSKKFWYVFRKGKCWSVFSPLKKIWSVFFTKENIIHSLSTPRKILMCSSIPQCQTLSSIFKENFDSLFNVIMCSSILQRQNMLSFFFSQNFDLFSSPNSSFPFKFLFVLLQIHILMCASLNSQENSNVLITL